MVHLTSAKPRRSAKDVALDCLSRRALTYCELEARLKEKGYESSEIRAVLEKMLEWGYLNDEELAFMYSKSRLKRYSRRRVQQDMQNRGLVPQLIEQALGENYSSNDEFEQCLTLAERWWVQEGKRWEHKNAIENAKKMIPRELWVQQKIARKLIQRGYPTDMVRNVLSQIKINQSEDVEI
ncbi:MAG: RecX family transcriptional regulator [Desulfosporosinus sp.]|nr:RecX family transcriptional regulator [Desulfosporosinus sp.]